MSGGSYSYIQYKDTDELISSLDMIAEVGYMAHALKTSYGPEGVAAGEATQKLHDRLLEGREQIQALTKELDAHIYSLKDVWRQVDYSVSLDVSKESVIEELVKYNERMARYSALQPSPVPATHPVEGVTEHGHCKDCGYAVISVCCNEGDWQQLAAGREWDWWMYCTNKTCTNHAGVGYFQTDPTFLDRKRT